MRIAGVSVEIVDRKNGRNVIQGLALKPDT